MAGSAARETDFVAGLLRWVRSGVDLRGGARNAALVVIPLIIGFWIGLAEAAVLVTVGALNLLLVETPYPGKTPSRVLLVATGTNALAFAAGTVLGLVPRPVELPFVAIGLFLALWGSRYPRWENVSFIAAVMFTFAVGVPPTTALGVILRPGAILLGGLWTLSALTFLSALYSARAPAGSRTGPPPSGIATSASAVTVHAAVVAATATAGLWIGLDLGLPRDYWVVLTVLVALRLDLATTVSYSLTRTFGTIVGAAGAYVVTSLTSDVWVLLPALFATTMLTFVTRSVNYIVYSVGITLTIIVLLNLVYSGGPTLAVDRIFDTVIGGALALAAAGALAAGYWRRSRRSPIRS